jgi:glutamine synthetase
MSSSDVAKLIKENAVKWADLRFTDTRGKEQHVSIPSRYVTTHPVEFEMYYSV